MAHGRATQVSTGWRSRLLRSRRAARPRDAHARRCCTAECMFITPRWFSRRRPELVASRTLSTTPVDDAPTVATSRSRPTPRLGANARASFTSSTTLAFVAAASSSPPRAVAAASRLARRADVLLVLVARVRIVAVVDTRTVVTSRDILYSAPVVVVVVVVERNPIRRPIQSSPIGIDDRTNPRARVGRIDGLVVARAREPRDGAFVAAARADAREASSKGVVRAPCAVTLDRLAASTSPDQGASPPRCRASAVPLFPTRSPRQPAA